MIVYVIMYGSGQKWLEPVNLDNPPFRADEYTITNGETYRQEESKE